MNEQVDRVYHDPEDFVCERCDSTEGYWITDRSFNGVAIHCRGCGNIEKRVRPWKEELEFLHSLRKTAKVKSCCNGERERCSNDPPPHSSSRTRTQLQKAKVME